MAGPDKGKRAVGERESLTVGAASDNDLVLSDNTVSRYHLELRQVDGEIVVEDLRSTNGTVLGDAIIERAKLRPGAILQLGQTRIQVSDGAKLSLEALDTESYCGIYGRSQIMRRLMARVQTAAQADVSVLVCGETGVGKEVIARAIHEGSPRSSGPFEIVDCAALEPQLVASELFGHEQGAFTGAQSRYIGAFERGNGGTVFLDELGELSPSLQPNLLGVLERRQFRRLGGTTPIDVDVRLISATHRDLRALVNTRAFRQDLYYRIASVRIDAPPLRERPEDIPVLVEKFLGDANHQGAISDIISAEQMERLTQYGWPGNVRELRNFLESYLAMGEAPEISSTHDNGTSGPSLEFKNIENLNYRDAKKRMLHAFERHYVQAILNKSKGNVSEGAKRAEISRRYFFEMLKRSGLR